jgi:hypothetical protein
MATVPQPHTWVANDNATSTALQTLTDPINYLLGNATSTGVYRPLAQLYQSVAQSIGNAAWTALTFDTETLDRDNGHSTTSNTSRYTAQTAGYYLVIGGVDWAPNATGNRLIRFAVNGTAVAGSTAGQVGFATQDPGLTIARLIYLNVNDYVETHVYQTSGSALNTGSGSGGEHGCVMHVEWRSN